MRLTVLPRAQKAQARSAPQGQVWRMQGRSGATPLLAGVRVAVRVEGDGANDGLFFLLADHQGNVLPGSVSTTVNADGLGVVSEMLFDAWGGVRYAAGETRTDHQYTGQRATDLGLHYFNARWQDPLLGRFITPDTVVPTESQGVLAWDRYQFVNSNPLRWNDPSGHCLICTLVVLAISAIILTSDVPQLAPGEAGNVLDLVVDGLSHEKHAIIVNEGLQSLQDDPSVRAAKGRLIDKIRNVPEYRNQAYSYENISDQFVADGPNGNWKQAALEGNQAFWMVRGGTISATNTKVSSDGTIFTTLHIHDHFDFIPGPKRSEDYNYWASKVHYLYNDLLGAEESFPTDAYWNETIPPFKSRTRLPNSY